MMREQEPSLRTTAPLTVALRWQNNVMVLNVRTCCHHEEKPRPELRRDTAGKTIFSHFQILG